jgi:hypothetical protein
VLQGSFYSGNATTLFANLPTNGTGFLAFFAGGGLFDLAAMVLAALCG